MKRENLLKIFTLLIFSAALIGVASAQEIVVSNGGLLGIEGEYSLNLTEVSYGDTLFIKVQNVSSAENYVITVNGESAGNGEAVYTVSEESGTLTIATIPETTTITVSVQKPDGVMYYIAKYMVFVKELPQLTGTPFIDYTLYAVLIVPVGAAVLLRIGIGILRFVI